MRILVAGATGFIGRRFVAAAMEAGHDVFSISRRTDHGLPCKTLIAGDTLDAFHYRELMKTERVEVVVNLLAAGVEPSDRDTERLLRANAAFPASLALSAADSGVATFVQIGSSAEYAPVSDGRPLSETTALEDTRLYGATKAAGSLLLQATGHAKGLPVAVLRAFNIFGAGEKPHRLFPSLANRLSRNEAVNLSAGTQVRDFLHVDDACDAILRTTLALRTGTLEPGAYNLGSGQPVSVRDFVSTLAGLMQADSALLRFGALPMRPDDLPFVVADTTKLTAAIGPAQRHSLADSLQQSLRDMNPGVVT